MLKDSLLMRAYRGESTPRAPIWLMRQAGRYMPEYRAIRAKHSMLEVIRTPELACEVTLQPIDRFGFDGSIIFADILTPLIGMGMELDFIEKEGPKIFNPIRSSNDIEKLKVPSPEENVGYTLNAIEITSKELTPRGVPLLGFSGAPFTLSSYMIDRGEDKELGKALAFMRKEERAWHALQEKLVVLVSEFLIAQLKAGASAVQLFDSWLGALGPKEFSTKVLPYLKEIVTRVKAKRSEPVIFFATGTAGLYELLPQIGADVYGVDWRSTLTSAAKYFPQKPLQGNLDPTILLESWEYVKPHAQTVIEEGKKIKSHIFNLGHGILPQTPPENVEKLVALVKGG